MSDYRENQEGCFCKECGCLTNGRALKEGSLIITKNCSHEHDRLRSIGYKYCTYCGEKL
jgi:hypothetical protein